MYLAGEADFGHRVGGKQAISCRVRTALRHGSHLEVAMTRLREAAIKNLFGVQAPVLDRQSRRDNAVGVRVCVAIGHSIKRPELHGVLTSISDLYSVVCFCLERLLGQCCEGSHRAFCRGREPLAREWHAGPWIQRPRVNELGAIRFIATDMRTGQRPVETVRRADLVISLKLSRADTTLDVAQARHFERKVPELLARSDFLPRFIVGRAVVSRTQREARCAAYQRAGVEHTAPQHAASSRQPAVPIDFVSTTNRRGLRLRAYFTRPYFLAVRVRAGQYVADALAEDRFVAPYRETKTARWSAGVIRGGPRVPERIHEEVHLILRNVAIEPAGRSDHARNASG